MMRPSSQRAFASTACARTTAEDASINSSTVLATEREADAGDGKHASAARRDPTINRVMTVRWQVQARPFTRNESCASDARCYTLHVDFLIGAIAAMWLTPHLHATPVVWQREPAAAACPSQESVAATFAEGSHPTDKRARVTVLKTTDGFGARIEIEDANGRTVGTRELSVVGPDCDALVRATVLVVSLALREDPARPSEPNAEDASRKPAPADALPEPTPDAALSEPTSSPRVALTIGLAPSLGYVPAPTVGASGQARIRTGHRTSLLLGGDYQPTVTAPDNSVAYGLWFGRAGLCGHVWDRNSVQIFGCGYGAAGRSTARGPSGPIDHEGARAWLAFGARAGADLRIAGPLVFEFAVDAAVPLSRPRYLTQRCGPTGFEQPPVVGSVFFGSGIIFP